MTAAVPPGSTTSAAVPLVTLLGRDGCHLCLDARAAVLRVREQVPFELIEIDVDSDPELQAEFGDQVPVVLVDGRMHSYFRLDEGRLRVALSSAT